MSSLNRRQFVSGAALLAASATIGGGARAQAPSDTTIRWWDNSGPLEKFYSQFAADFATRNGITIEHTRNEQTAHAQAVQLAKQSNQLPDMYTTAGLSLLVPAMIGSGWMQPIQFSSEAYDRVKDDLIEGIHTFGGKPYTWPLFSYKQYVTNPFFNKTLITAAGLDPATPPVTYDDFRAACAKIQQATPGTYGMAMALSNSARMTQQVNELAQAAGFPGMNGVKFLTGEYAYDDDTYVQAIEFFKSLDQDGLMLPGAQSLSTSTGRARWATGVFGYYFDGCWSAGGIVNNLSEFADKMDVGQILIPDAAKAPTIYQPPAVGTFYLAATSKYPEITSQILSEMTTDAFAAGLAQAMDQPPFRLDAIKQANVHPAYARVTEYYQKWVYLAPSSVVRNPDISVVDAKAQPISPDLGTILQGVMSGDITDIKGALKTLSDASSADRDRSLQAAQAEGAKVSIDDYAFPDWKAQTNYQFGA